MNVSFASDINSFVTSFKLPIVNSGSSFLVTGATGLVGSTLVHCLLALNLGIHITCPVRNKKKALAIFETDFDRLNCVECDLSEYLSLLGTDVKFDYIVHCASPTSGKYMTEYPVETYELAIETTRALLKYAHTTNVKGLVYVSSLESYGQILDDRLITEDVQGYIDMQDARSSYPMGKRAAEYLCFSYFKEYGVNVKVARLTQTFGAGISKDDNRVFAQFAKSVIDETDIILHTKGESAKPYCYTTDCISAILYILLKGKNGEVYNVANQDTYISIKDMACFLRDNFNPSINVKVELNDSMGYAPVTKLRLSSEKLMSLGWRPKYGLREMFERLIEYLKEECDEIQY